jgi:hypothetical protein
MSAAKSANPGRVKKYFLIALLLPNDDRVGWEPESGTLHGHHIFLGDGWDRGGGGGT